MSRRIGSLLAAAGTPALMLVVRGPQDVPAEARGAVLAIGNFDGVHRGHQALLAETRKQAASLGAKAGVITFEPHPRAFFQPQQPLFLLTPVEQKLDLLARYGCEVAVVLAFDRALAGLSADDYIARILIERLGVRHVVIGYDFHFGKGRLGSPQTLVEASRRSGRFGVTVMQPVSAGAEVASSSVARAALAAGEVERAAAVLGHWWRATGVVTGGAKRGTGMGYPTANIALPAGTDLAHGIYAARVYVEGQAHAGAAYLGTRPTFDHGAPVLETFLLDFDGDLYGRPIAVEFIARLRGDQAFVDMAGLIAQMDRDVAAARQRLDVLERRDPWPWPAHKP